MKKYLFSIILSVLVMASVVEASNQREQAKAELEKQIQVLETARDSIQMEMELTERILRLADRMFGNYRWLNQDFLRNRNIQVYTQKNVEHLTKE